MLHTDCDPARTGACGRDGPLRSTGPAGRHCGRCFWRASAQQAPPETPVGLQPPVPTSSELEPQGAEQRGECSTATQQPAQTEALRVRSERTFPGNIHRTLTGVHSEPASPDAATVLASVMSYWVWGRGLGPWPGAHVPPSRAPTHGPASSLSVRGRGCSDVLRVGLQLSLGTGLNAPGHPQRSAPHPKQGHSCS